LIENPNVDIPKITLINELKLTATKDLTKVVDNLNFTGDLRKLFFNVGADLIKLTNPITKRVLKDKGLSKITLFPPKPTPKKPK
jgi:hypothetical protein